MKQAKRLVSEWKLLSNALQVLFHFNGSEKNMQIIEDIGHLVNCRTRTHCYCSPLKLVVDEETNFGITAGTPPLTHAHTHTDTHTRTHTHSLTHSQISIKIEVRMDSKKISDIFFTYFKGSWKMVPKTINCKGIYMEIWEKSRREQGRGRKNSLAVFFLRLNCLGKLYENWEKCKFI